jgi:hypothetical protein
MLVEQLRVAQKTLVFIERVFVAPEAVLVLQLGMALPATIFVAIVLTAPESPFIPQAGVTDEAQLLGGAVRGAGGTVGLRLGSRCCRLRGGRCPFVGRRAGREQEQNSDEAREQHSVSSQINRFHVHSLTLAFDSSERLS